MKSSAKYYFLMMCLFFGASSLQIHAIRERFASHDKLPPEIKKNLADNGPYQKAFEKILYCAEKKPKDTSSSTWNYCYSDHLDLPPIPNELITPWWKKQNPYHFHIHDKKGPLCRDLARIIMGLIKGENLTPSQEDQILNDIFKLIPCENY